jgi:hypothetical protein
MAILVQNMDSVHYNKVRKRIGEYRVQRMKVYFESKGCKVTTFPVEATGLDMIVETEEYIMGVEVTNWNKKGYLNFDRLSNMIQNWNDLEFQLKRNKDTREYRRLLIYSYTENIENMLPYLYENKVELMKIGYQDLPKEIENEKEIEAWIE